jgi:hypothetical protein
VDAGGAPFDGEPVTGSEPSEGVPGEPPKATAAADVGSTITAPPPVASNGSRRSLVIGIVGAAVVVVLVVLGVFVFFKVSAAISAGSGTATLTWTPALGSGDSDTGPPQPFTGTIGGHSMSGVSTFVLPANPTGPDALRNAQVFHYKGSFDGKSFDLGGQIGGQSINSVVLLITGTYDGQAVHAVLSPPSNPNLTNPPIPFHGTIGKWKVKGIIRGPTGSGQKQTATATYTVSS